MGTTPLSLANAVGNATNSAHLRSTTPHTSNEWHTGSRNGRVLGWRHLISAAEQAHHMKQSSVRVVREAAVGRERYKWDDQE